MENGGERDFERALERFAAVSQVVALVLSKESLSRAIIKVSKMQQNSHKSISRATLYRWHKAYTTQGFEGLFDEPRTLKGSGLDSDFLDFLKSEKNKDPGASIPEVIARARELGVVDREGAINRSTVYRAARSLNLPIFRRKKAEATTMRPFAYEHRMIMVLCDGKHFRAGASGAKRVALIFIDDATRYVLDIFVGFTEDAAFFLRSLHKVLENFGHMGSLYLDHGPGFTASDTKKVFGSLKIPFIYGKVRYPEGHAKIERFNSTITQDLLRGLHKPDIDPSCSALELRLRHYIRERYNRKFHSGLNAIPEETFQHDTKPLHFPLTSDELKRAFVVTETRLVRRDNVINWNGSVFEVPLGHSGRKLTVYRDLIGQKIWILHHGEAFELHPPDLALNARERRASSAAPEQLRGPITTAAEIHFNRHFRPIVGEDGGFTDKPSQQEN